MPIAPAARAPSPDFDRRCDRRVFADRPRHAALLRQRQAPVAIDMNLDLFDQRPNSRIARRLGDGAVEGLIRLMEGAAVAGSARFALALQLGEEGDDLAALGALGGEPRGCLLERLPNDDRLGQRAERNTGRECARLREYLDEPLVGELAHRLAHRRAAEAVGCRQLGL